MIASTEVDFKSLYNFEYLPALETLSRLLQRYKGVDVLHGRVLQLLQVHVILNVNDYTDRPVVIPLPVADITIANHN